MKLLVLQVIYSWTYYIHTFHVFLFVSEQYWIFAPCKITILLTPYTENVVMAAVI